MSIYNLKHRTTESKETLPQINFRSYLIHLLPYGTCYPGSSFFNLYLKPLNNIGCFPQNLMRT